MALYLVNQPLNRYRVVNIFEMIDPPLILKQPPSIRKSAASIRLCNTKS